MKKIFSVLSLLSILLLAVSCKKGTTDSDGAAIVKPALTGADLSNQISSQVNNIVNTALTQSSGAIDIGTIIANVKKLSNVTDCYAAIGGHSIIIKQSDGIIINFLLYSPTDTLSSTIKVNDVGQKQKIATNALKTNSSLPYIFPIGKKVLILAPFQHDFHNNLDVIAEMFRSRGFSVDELIDTAVKLSIFRDATLSKYDVIYIDTHGGAGIGLASGKETATVFLTGEVANMRTFQALSDKERASVAIQGHAGSSQAYFGISAQFLKCNSNLSFNKTWVIMQACETLYNNDLANYFLQQGAIAFNGYSTEINVALAQCITTKMVSVMTNFNSIDDTYNRIVNDAGFNRLSIFIRILNNNVDVSSFQMAKSVIDKNYALVDNDDVQASFPVDYGSIGTTTNVFALIGGTSYDPSTFGGFSVSSYSPVESWQLQPYKNFPQEYTNNITINDNSGITPRSKVFFFIATDKSGNPIANGNTTFTIL